MPYFLHIYLTLSLRSLCIRYDYMPLIVFILGKVPPFSVTTGLLLSSSLGCLWVLSTLLFSWLLLINFLSTLSKDHLGYLHLVRAFLRCCISLLRSLDFMQTVLALWVRVLITLYLATRLWWLSHCKYGCKQQLPTNCSTLVYQMTVIPNFFLAYIGKYSYVVMSFMTSSRQKHMCKIARLLIGQIFFTLWVT